MQSPRCTACSLSARSLPRDSDIFWIQFGMSRNGEEIRLSIRLGRRNSCSNRPKPQQQDRTDPDKISLHSSTSSPAPPPTLASGALHRTTPHPPHRITYDLPEPKLQISRQCFNVPDFSRPKTETKKRKIRPHPPRGALLRDFVGRNLGIRKLLFEKKKTIINPPLGFHSMYSFWGFLGKKENIWTLWEIQQNTPPPSPSFSPSFLTSAEIKRRNGCGEGGKDER